MYSCQSHYYRNYFPPANDKEDSRKSPEQKTPEEVKTNFSSSFSAPSPFAAPTLHKDILRISPKLKETPGPQDPNRHRYQHQQQLQQHTASIPDDHDEDEDEFVLVTGDLY